MKMKMFKRWRKKGVCVVLACMLALTPVGSGIASASIAEDSAIAQSDATVKAAAAIIASGTCGAVSENNVKWVVYDNGVLEISGSGTMKDYSFSISSSSSSSGTKYTYASGTVKYYKSTAPWFAYSSSITTIKVGSGVTNIGNYAFLGLANATSISIPSGLTSIGKGAVAICSKITSVTIPSSVTVINTEAFFGDQSLQTLTFQGGAPEFGDDVLYGTAAILTVKFPLYNSSWTSSVRKDYGGTPIWVGYKGSQSIVPTEKTFKQKIKVKALKKKNQTFKLKAKAAGKITYKKLSGDKQIKVKRNGKVTVKKGTKKGTYKITVQVKAKATNIYNKATITKTVTVKVK